MKSLTCCLAAALCLAGCRAPAPTFKDVSPFGATRIEPPRTNSFGNPDSYYQPPAPGNPAGAGLGPSGPGEQLVTLTRGGDQHSNIALVGHDQDDDQGEWEVWEDIRFDRRSDGPDEERDSVDQDRLLTSGGYQPGSVAVAAGARATTSQDAAPRTTPGRDEYVGQVREPATLQILDASPLPGETEASWASSTSRSQAGTSSQSNTTVAVSGSAPRLNPMPVHDVTTFGQEDAAPQASSLDDQIELRDIGELPPVPDTIRERMAEESRELDRTMTRSPGNVASSTSGASSSRAGSTGDVSGWRVR